MGCIWSLPVIENGTREVDLTVNYARYTRITTTVSDGTYTSPNAISPSTPQKHPTLTELPANLPPHLQDPEFTGRRVVTVHCQRDYLFVRHHRYIFPEDKQGKKARLQEIGPRFTLKLRSLQAGTFDSSRGEYEWIHKKEKETSKKRFFL